MKKILIQYRLSNLVAVVFSPLVFCALFLSDINQKQAVAQTAETEVYWVYEKGNLDYRQPLLNASQKGIQVDAQKRKLIFRVQMNQAAYERLMQNKALFPIHVEWYRYNRAKLSFFCSDQLTSKDIQRVVIKEDTFYRLSSSQQNILGGTWVVRISDAKGNLIELNGKNEFDVIVF